MYYYGIIEDFIIQLDIQLRNNIADDAELVYDYLRNEIGAKGQIGAHGESLGGYAATHLGKYKNLKFVFIDRSFCSIDKVVKIKYGSCSLKWFKMISNWNIQSDRNYLDSNCFKIVSQDSNDVVVNDLGNLKSGITSRMINKSMEFSHLKESDAEDLIWYLFNFEKDKNYLWILFKYFQNKSKENFEEEKKSQERHDSFRKSGKNSFLPQFVNRSEDIKSVSNFTKASSRGSIFKSMTLSAAQKQKAGWGNEELKHEEHWNVSLYILKIGWEWICSITKWN